MSDFDFDKIDKSKWKKFRFDQIALSISKRVEPNDTDLEVYVGLEHIDSDSIHIKRTGVPSDVEGTKLRVYPGDVIFGKRRAYQRKAAIAEFDGICSAHAMVLRANEKVIDTNLFPFFLHSDYFMHRAIDISVGSLSPTINWGTLKTQEFLLPPKEHQAKLAELLWAADATIESEIHLKAVLEKVLKAYRRKVFVEDPTTNNYEVKKGEEITSLISKGSSPNWQGFSYTNEGMLFVTSENVGDGFLDLSVKKYLPIEFHEKLKRSQLSKGDILINIVGASIGRACVYEMEGTIANVNQAVCVFRPHKEFNSIYLLNYLLTDEILNKLLSNQSESARANLSLTNMREFEFITPSECIQDEIAAKIADINNSIDFVIKGILKSKNIQKQLMNQIFSA